MNWDDPRTLLLFLVAELAIVAWVYIDEALDAKRRARRIGGGNLNDPVRLASLEHEVLSADRDGLSPWNHPSGCPRCQVVAA